MGKNNEELKDYKPLRKQVIIELEEYGGTGRLVLEELTAGRDRILNNNLGLCTITDLKTQQASVKLGDQAIYLRMGYTVEAPFMSSPNALTIDNWIRFMDRFSDSGRALSKRIDAEIVKMRKDSGTPLAESAQADSQK